MSDALDRLAEMVEAVREVGPHRPERYAAAAQQSATRLNHENATRSADLLSDRLALAEEVIAAARFCECPDLRADGSSCGACPVCHLIDALARYDEGP